MIKEYVLLEEENVKKFNLNINIKTYKEYINYFYNLKDEDRSTIVFYCLIYKKYFPNIKNGNLDKIYNVYKILLHKLEYDNLNHKEKNIYEFIKSYMIICEEFENDNLFEKYCDKYLKDLNRNNINKRLLIILQDMMNQLNKTYNKDYSIILGVTNDIAVTEWFQKKFKGKLILNSSTYVDLFYSNKIDDINVLCTLTVQSFIILHEYKHLLQNEYMRTNYDLKADIYRFELYTIYNDKKGSKLNKFYLDNHNSYQIEREANDFALNNFFKYIKKYFENYYINEDDLKEFLIKHWTIKENTKKSFLLKYKILKKYLETCKKLPIKPKKILLFNECLKEYHS